MMKPPESFLGQPVRSLQTMLRVIRAAAGQDFHIVPDGIYGPVTMAAVSAFQELAGIPVTGVTDLQTWQLIVRAYHRALPEVLQAQPLQVHLAAGQIIGRREHHPTLYLVQAMLYALSDCYASIPQPPVSGILDSGTEEALIAFQHLSALPETGQLDKTTWKHLVLQYHLAAGQEEIPPETTENPSI